MRKIVLRNDAHIFQMLGNFDQGHGYALPKDIAELLIKMPKVPIVSEDEIDVGIDVAFLKSNCGTQFCLENSILYLVERATEMGGLVAFTYLSPLVEITAEYFENLESDQDLTPIKERVVKRRAQYATMLAEHERLARSANRRAQKTLNAHPIPEFDETVAIGKRFVRLGKPDYCTSQLQILAHVIDKNNLTHPASEIIDRWKTACNNKTSAKLYSEPLSELHMPETTGVKKDETSDSDKGKKINFRSLLAVMMKQDTPKKAPTRLKSCENVVQILDSEEEVEQGFEPTQQGEPADEITENPQQKNHEDEIKLQQLVAALLKNYQPNAVEDTQAPSSKKTRTRTKVSQQDILKDQLSEHVPVSSNHDLEQ